MTNNTVDLTNYFIQTPSMEEVKDFLTKTSNEGKVYMTSSPDWLIDIPSTSKRKDHIAKSSQFKFMNKAQKRRHNKYIMAIEVLLSKAVYTGESTNRKFLEKPDVVKYHYFKVEAKISDKIYEIIFDAEEHISDKTSKPQIVHLYDIKEK